MTWSEGIKGAKLPVNHDLDHYDYSFINGVSKQQLNQLKECQWLEQNFNIVLMGPSGTGKTFIASGLCNEALKKGIKLTSGQWNKSMKPLL